MEIASGMASAAALNQDRVRQDFGMAALAQSAKAEAGMAGLLEKAVRDGAGQGDSGGTVTDTRGNNLSVTV